MNDFHNNLKEWYILDNKFRDLSLQLNDIISVILYEEKFNYKIE